MFLYIKKIFFQQRQSFLLSLLFLTLLSLLPTFSFASEVDNQNQTNSCATSLSLSDASFHGCTKKAEEILKKDIDSSEMSFALILALQKGHIDIAKSIVKKIADLHSKDAFGESIITAIKHKHYDMIKLLRDYGADVGQSQTVIEYNLGLYLDKFSSRDQKFIKRFREHGFCSGLSTLWLHAKWLDTELKKDSRYDGKWFASTVKAICEWDGEKNLGKSVFFDFEEFISLIDFFQNPYIYGDKSQNDIGSLISLKLPNVDRKPLKKTYSIAGEFTPDQIYNLLNTIIHDNELIYVRCIGHIMALFKCENSYYFYDPSAHKGEIKYTAIDKIAKTISSLKIPKDKGLVIGFNIWSFDEKSHEHPKQKDILANSLITIEGLIISIEIGCLDSLKFFLDKKIDPNEVGCRGWTALMFASQYGYIDIVNELLTSGAKVNQQTSDGGTALMAAATCGHSGVVKILLKNGADPNLQTISGTTALMAAAFYGHNETVKVLLEKWADQNLVADDSGEIDTAYTFAIKGGHPEIAKLLANTCNIDQNSNKEFFNQLYQPA